TSGNTGGLFGGLIDGELPVVRLKVQSNMNVYSDESVIVFDQGTPQYEAGDVEMLVWSHPQAPRIATRSNEGHDLSINMFGMFSEAISIPVMVDLQVDGTYSITVNEIAGIDGLSCLNLEDLVTGTMTPIALDASYSFEMLAADDASTPRFMIHATAPI